MHLMLQIFSPGARCQHSDVFRYPEIVRGGTPGWTRLLRDRAENALTN
jgi:hypothetical protein